MWKKWFTAFLLAISSLAFATDYDELDALEKSWIILASPVINTALNELNLPLDVVVLSQPTPNFGPVGIRYKDGRCHLILSIKNNPAALKLILSMDEGIKDILIQAIVAHEIGHCWRMVRNEIGELPPHFTVIPSTPVVEEMNMKRREEGFADLVGLAWVHKHHPRRYEQVHAWFTKSRANPPIAGAPHDTRAWIRLAKKEAFEKTRGSIFEQAKHIWQQGLLKEY